MSPMLRVWIGILSSQRFEDRLHAFGRPLRPIDSSSDRRRPLAGARGLRRRRSECRTRRDGGADARGRRSEEHTSELQSLMRISYAVFCLKKKTKIQTRQHRAILADEST